MEPNSKKRTLLEFTINIALILLFPLSRPFQELCKEFKKIKGQPGVALALTGDTPAEVTPAPAGDTPAGDTPDGVTPLPVGDTPTEDTPTKGARRLKELLSKNSAQLQFVAIVVCKTILHNLKSIVSLT